MASTNNATRPPTSTQLATALPGPTTYITGHAPSGDAVIHAARPVQWTHHDDGKIAMSVAYTTTFPANLNDDADLAAHDARAAAGPMGLVGKGGTVLRYVDFAPGHECMMHRTRSVDYGIVVEGTVLAVMGSGETRRMGRGDVMVQRATMHSWRNPSETEWARMVFVLQDCEALVVGGRAMGEDLGRGTDGVPPSGNDD